MKNLLPLFILILSAVVSAQTQAYVVNDCEGYISLLDLASGNTIDTIPIRTYDLEISPDGSRLYAVTVNSVAVIDTSTKSVIADIPVHAPISLTITPDGSKIYAASFFLGNPLTVISTLTNNVIATIPMRRTGTGGVAVTPDGRFLYVSNGGIVALVNTSTNVIERETLITSESGGIVVAPNGRVYLSVLVGSFLPTNTSGIFTTGAYNLTINPASSFLYGTLTDNRVVVINTADNTLVTTFNPGAASSTIAFNFDGTLAYISHSSADFISVVDTATHNVVRRISNVDCPVEIVFAKIPVNPDPDNDGILNAADNCPTVSNADQRDNDGDFLGDACDPDDDNDTVQDTVDNCQFTANFDQLDTDGDFIGNACETDDDNDGSDDILDNCPVNANADQLDFDRDGIGDACDAQTGGVTAREQCLGGNYRRFDFPRPFKNERDCLSSLTPLRMRFLGWEKNL